MKGKKKLAIDKKKQMMVIGAITGVALIITIILAITSCGKDEESKKPINLLPGVTETQETEVIEEVNEYQNLLTGKNTLTDAAIGQRPVAIMINNLPKAMPQYGVAEADVIFEIPIEGGATRFMALYGDYTQVPEVCSIRSCRKYFPEIAKGYDAFYICSGMNDDVRSYVRTLDINLYDAGSDNAGLFAQDQDRKSAGYSSEDTWVFDGTRFPELVEDKEWRTALEEDNLDTFFKFCDVYTKVVPTGGECQSVNVDFGAIEATLFYDEASNKYLKQLNGKDQVDGVTGDQLAFTNVLLLETQVGNDENGANKTINWKGGDSSVAYYISNGSMQEIHYKKDSTSSRLVFYDLDGNELEINRGKTYIAFYPTGKVTFE